jgi:uncharacterized lipoprotein YmbA
MTIRGYLQNIGPAIFAAIFILAGCRSATSPVEFYTLTPLTAMSEEQKAVELNDTIAVGVGPVEIPKINDRQQIVTRTGPNKINVEEFHRWAGSLYEDFLRVLTVNLSVLLHTNLVEAYPWEDYFDPDYRVFMQVHQFDGQLGEYVVLDATWTITGREAKEVLLVRKSRMKEPVQGMSYEAFVAAKSRILADLSRKIAHEIESLKTSN